MRGFRKCTENLYEVLNCANIKMIKKFQIEQTNKKALAMVQETSFKKYRNSPKPHPIRVLPWLVHSASGTPPGIFPEGRPPSSNTGSPSSVNSWTDWLNPWKKQQIHVCLWSSCELSKRKIPKSTWWWLLWCIEVVYQETVYHYVRCWPRCLQKRAKKTANCQILGHKAFVFLDLATYERTNMIE